MASAGVPMRRPEASIGGRGSKGTALRLTVMPISCRRSSACLPLSSGSQLAQVDEHQVHVGAAGQHARRRGPAPAAASRRRAPGRRRPCGAGARRRARSRRSAARPPWRRSRAPAARPAGRGRRPSRSSWRSSSLHRIIPARGPPSVLWVVVVTTSAPNSSGLGCRPGGDQPGEVGHVDHQQRADLVGDLAEAREVELARVGRPAGEQQLRPALARDPRDLVHVDQAASRGRPRRRRRRTGGPETFIFMPWVRWPPWASERPMIVSPGSSSAW